MKIAYCDCFSGISGDMFLAALIDAGLQIDYLREQIGLLAIEEHIDLRAEDVRKGALRATQITVGVDDSHNHRHLGDIQSLVEDSRLADPVKRSAIEIFQVLAEAEGKVHGISPQQVHFHEVGALDSIVDVVGAAIGLHALGIERLYASSLPYGSGQIRSDHGPLPLPAPATLEILAKVHAPLVASMAQAELVTPTGAAILAAQATFQRPDIILDHIGIGAGRKEFPWPNIMRMWVGFTSAESDQPYVLMETNIDDMNPQFYGEVMTRLFEAGARDVFFTPIYMKKNRPATMVSVLARRSEEAVLARVLLENTSTLGMRVQPVYRFEAEREFKQVETIYGSISVKIKILDGRRMQAQPEYEDCLAAAEKTGVAVGEVYNAAMAAGLKYL
jgi:pyridinium-3,5-bisthiocarboxylic acid mononucleotide nickel chelatase